MKSANAFSAVSATVSSGISAVAIGIFNIPDKKDDTLSSLNPKIQEAVKAIDSQLNKMVKMATSDLVRELHMFPKCINAIENGICEAEGLLLQNTKSNEAKVLIQHTIQVAKDGLK